MDSANLKLELDSRIEEIKGELAKIREILNNINVEKGIWMQREKYLLNVYAAITKILDLVK